MCSTFKVFRGFQKKRNVQVAKVLEFLKEKVQPLKFLKRFSKI